MCSCYKKLKVAKREISENEVPAFFVGRLKLISEYITLNFSYFMEVGSGMLIKYLKAIYYCKV